VPAGKRLLTPAYEATPQALAISSLMYRKSGCHILLCGQVWCDVHKLSLKRRLSELGVPLYQRLLQVSVKFLENTANAAQVPCFARLWGESLTDF
jgi:hypothetical protein